MIERTWHAVAPGGAQTTVTLRVGPPAREGSGDWAVEVSLDGLEPGARKIFGVDGWQAADLGMRFIADRVVDFSDRGWHFFRERGGEPASAKDLYVGR